MTEKIFVDSNVLVYARDSSEVGKQPLAEAWMRHLLETRRGCLSIQVLQEFYLIVTRKLDPGLTKSAARQDVEALLSWQPLHLDMGILDGAWCLEDKYSLSWWDALIVSAAQVAGCSHLLSEDLQAGQRFGEVRVVNPFETAP